MSLVFHEVLLLPQGLRRIPEVDMSYRCYTVV